MDERTMVPTSGAPVPLTVAVTCPVCETPGHVDPRARSADGFCTKCQFPLFWAADRVLGPATGDGHDDSSRRLPGTAGRQELASVTCPHCAEPNSLTAVYCVRCGQDMRPPPPVVYVTPPPVVVAPVVVEHVNEPEPPWWPWALALVLTVVVLVVVLVLLAR